MHHDKRLRSRVLKFQSRKADDLLTRKFTTPSAFGTTEFMPGQSRFSVLTPPVAPERLHSMPNENSVLRQCIDAYVTNIEGQGFRLEYIGPDGEENSAAALAEKHYLESVTTTPNERYSFTELRKRLRRDFETYGYAYMELLRDAADDVKSSVRMLYHVPAYTVRMTSEDPEPVTIEVPVLVGGKWTTRKVSRKFRRFCQRVGTATMWFKEFGDPRPIRADTGMVDENAAEADLATEILHMAQYAPDFVYGLPRWINQLPSVLGMRESEMTNYSFFRDNAIPSMAVLVSGGSLTEEAVQTIADLFTSKAGRESMNRIVVLEAMGDAEMAAEDGRIPAPRVDLKPLADERQKDAMFQTYETNAAKKIRSSFRLPPLFIGTTEDMTHATAAASLAVAEAQVFRPEREQSDELFNTRVFRMDGLPLQYWRVRSNPPKIVNQDSVISALGEFSDMGALTPNKAVAMLNELFGLQMGEMDAEWANMPFQLVRDMVRAGTLDPRAGGERISETEPVADRATGGDAANTGQNSSVDEPAQEDDAMPATKNFDPAKALSQRSANDRGEILLTAEQDNDSESS